MPTRILLVEDNPGDAIIFREKLNASDLDYELTHTKRLSEGLEMLGSATYDILLVDLSLPDAQGLEAVTRVREAAPDRPLIVLTGLDDARAAAEAKKLGAVDYLVKWYVDSVSLARYIRYAIAQYQMFDTGASDDAGFRPTSAEIAPRPRRSGGSGTVVEGKVVERPAPVEVSAEPEADTAVAEPSDVAESSDAGAPSDGALRDALTAVETAVLIVTEGREIVFASEAARAWVREDTYPWPVEEGRRRIPRKGRPLEQRASRTTWEGRAALLVTLSLAPDETPRPAPAPSAPSASAPATPSAAEVTLRRSTEAALAFVERTEQRSAWMADVLRSALDLHRTTHGDVTAQPTDLDALELAQQVVREQRSLAMSLGLPLRLTSTRKKVMAYGDRNLVNALLNRLVVDAVQSAGPEGVEVRAEVDRSVSKLEVEWTESSRAADFAVEACAGLGRDLVERMVEAVGGESEHERKAGGHHLVTVRLPGRAEA